MFLSPTQSFRPNPGFLRKKRLDRRQRRQQLDNEPAVERDGYIRWNVILASSFVGVGAVMLGLPSFPEVYHGLALA